LLSAVPWGWSWFLLAQTRYAQCFQWMLLDCLFGQSEILPSRAVWVDPVVLCFPSRTSLWEEATPLDLPCWCPTEWPFGSPFVFSCAGWPPWQDTFNSWNFVLCVVLGWWEHCGDTACCFGIFASSWFLGSLLWPFPEHEEVWTLLACWQPTLMDFLSEICRPSAGLDLLGSPVWGSDDFYESYFASKVEAVNLCITVYMLYIENPLFTIKGYPHLLR